MIQIKISCPKHPRYGAIQKPRVVCEACWDQWDFAERVRKGKSPGTDLVFKLVSP